MLVSSFYTVTQEVEDLIKSWEKKGLDYTLVMTDASNPFISSARREEFLEKTLGKKAVEVKHLMWNEYSEEEFINSIEAIIEEEKIKDLYFQTYVPKEDFDPMSLKENCTLHVLNAPKGDILDNLNSYLKGSDTWVRRCSNSFKQLVSMEPVFKHSVKNFGVVPYFIIDEERTMYLLGKDLVSDKVEILDSFIDDFTLVATMVEGLESVLNVETLDYDIKTFYDNDGAPRSVVFVEVENSEVLHKMNDSNDLSMFSEDCAYVFIEKDVGVTYNLQQAWIGVSLDVIKRTREIEKEMS